MSEEYKDWDGITATPSDPDMFWALRTARPADHAFITKSWLRSYERSAPHDRALRTQYLTNTNRVLGGQVRDAYFAQYHQVIEEVLDTSTILVACHRTEPDVVVGFVVGAVHSTGCLVLHYVYVVSRYRNAGVARCLVRELKDSLLPQITDSQVVVTCTTPSARLQISRYNACCVPITTFVGREGRKNQ